MRRLFVPIAVVVAMLVTAASAQAFVLKLQAPTHTPKVGQPWPIKVSAHTKSGKKIRASAFYQFVYQGKVVQACTPLPNQPGGQKCNDSATAPAVYKFKGSYRDVVIWPQKSLLAAGGLTFRVVVHQRHGGTKHVDYFVKPHA